MRLTASPLAVATEPNGVHFGVVPGGVVMKVTIDHRPYVLELGVNDARNIGVQLIGLAAIAETVAAAQPPPAKPLVLKHDGKG